MRGLLPFPRRRQRYKRVLTDLGVARQLEGLRLTRSTSGSHGEVANIVSNLRGGLAGTYPDSWRYRRRTSGNVFGSAR
jgi:hypothetical protein